MAQTTLTQSIVIYAPVERILHAIQFLEESTRYHPLVQHIDLLEAVTLPDGSTRRSYRVVDRVPLGPFKLRTVYTAIMTRPIGEQTVIAEAHQSPGVILRIRNDCVAGPDGGVTLTETIQIEASRILIGTVKRQAEAAHKRLMAELRDALGAEGITA